MPGKETFPRKLTIKMNKGADRDQHSIWWNIKYNLLVKKESAKRREYLEPLADSMGDGWIVMTRCESAIGMDNMTQSKQFRFPSLNRVDQYGFPVNIITITYISDGPKEKWTRDDVRMLAKKIMKFMIGQGVYPENLVSTLGRETIYP